MLNRADVLNYLRNTWGNSAELANIGQVADLHPRLDARDKTKTAHCYPLAPAKARSLSAANTLVATAPAGR